jgi:hypothetical protein
MDKTIAGLIGAVALSTPFASQAASPAPQSIEAAMQASSYADLLKPIPNAMSLVAANEPAASSEPAVVLAQYYYHRHHHYRRRHHYHHHHHDHA